MRKYVKTIDLLDFIVDEDFVIKYDGIKYYSWDEDDEYGLSGIPSDLLYDTHVVSIERVFVGYSDYIMIEVEYDYR